MNDIKYCKYEEINTLSEKEIINIIRLTDVSLGDIDDANITQEICNVAVNEFAFDIQYVPERFVNDELKYKAVRNNPDVLSHIEKPTNDIIMYVLSLDDTYDKGYVLSCIEDDLITKEMCDIALDDTYDNIRYVPDRYKTKEMCDKAFIYSYSCIRYIPNKFKTKEMCDKAFQDCITNLLYIPNKFKTKEMCDKAFSKDARFYKYIPDEFKEEHMYAKYKKAVDEYENRSGISTFRNCTPFNSGKNILIGSDLLPYIEI